MVKFGWIAVVSAAAFAGALVGSLIIKAPQKPDAPSIAAAFISNDVYPTEASENARLKAGARRFNCSQEPERLECVMGKFYVLPEGKPGI